jgi:uncharacterized protein YndB with AHSA1/START domain
MSEQATIEPLRVSVTVRCTPERAFRVFTERIADWWPLASFSVYEDEAQTVVIEGHVGGRIYEIATDGREGEWGRLSAWEPPDRIAYTWYPGRGPETAQEVEIRFTPQGEETLVEVVQTRWERLGERAPAAREGYRTGWGTVLGHFVRAAEEEA